jgi:hypothetical protein
MDRIKYANAATRLKTGGSGKAARNFASMRAEGSSLLGDFKRNGGERGIRTPGRGVSPYNGLANRRLQPLGHLSGVYRTDYI